MAKVGDDKVKLAFCMGDKGTNVIAANSYHAQILDMMTDNVAVVETPSSKGTGNEVDLEQIILWNPDVIIFNVESIYDTVGENKQWENINAIKNNEYYETPFGPYNWTGNPPSVQRFLGLMWYSEVLYGEYVDYDLETRVKEYYQMFYHQELSDTQYDNLVANSIARG